VTKIAIAAKTTAADKQRSKRIDPPPLGLSATQVTGRDHDRLPSATAREAMTQFAQANAFEEERNQRR
jgi:hypothetical protein